MATEDEETFWVHCQESVWAEFEIRQKGNVKSRSKSAVTDKVASNPFARAHPSESQIWTTKTMILMTRHIGDKAKARQEREEKADRIIIKNTNSKNVRNRRINTGGASYHAADCRPSRAYLCRLEWPRLGSIMELE